LTDAFFYIIIENRISDRHPIIPMDYFFSSRFPTLFGGYTEFIFFIQFWCIFYPSNWLSWELMVVCRLISSISCSYQDKVIGKGPTSDRFQNLNFLIFSTNFNEFVVVVFLLCLQNTHVYELFMSQCRNWPIFRGKEAKWSLNYEILHIWYLNPFYIFHLILKCLMLIFLWINCFKGSN